MAGDTRSELAEGYEKVPKEHLATARARSVEVWRQVRLAIFGDGVGLSIFLGALVFFGFYWRIGFFINDNWTIANTLVAVADGHLHMTSVPYGPPVSQPGMHEVDGRLYGRNYGHVFLSLPFLWLVQGLSAVADVAVLVAGAWSLLLLAFGLQVGRLLDQQREFALLGSVAALVFFAANVRFAQYVDPQWFPVVALQTSTMVAGALVGVLMYRVFARLHDRRVGVFVGAVTVLATPVGFWASVPKRHVVTTFFVVLAFYGFVVSRSGTDRFSLGHRALAYVAVGLLAWIHAFEALILLMVLFPLDLLSAPTNRPRELAWVAGAFLLSLVPLFATNELISGSVVTPPRMLPSASPELVEAVATGEPYLGAGPPSDPDSGGSILTAIFSRVYLFWNVYFAQGLAVVFEEPSRVYRTFLRSEWILHAQEHNEPAINLTVLESMPVLGALAVGPLLAIRTFGGRPTLGELRNDRTFLADLFAVAFVLLFSVSYMNRLPLHAQVTVRYLLPVFPFLVYFVGRLDSVRRVISNESQLFLWAYGLLVLLGGQLAVVGLVAIDPTIGEVMQLHAIVGLVVAAVVAAWALVDTYADGVDARGGAVVLATPIALGTLLLLLTGVEYLRYGEYALPVARLLGDALPIIAGA